MMDEYIRLLRGREFLRGTKEVPVKQVDAQQEKDEFHTGKGIAKKRIGGQGQVGESWLYI